MAGVLETMAHVDRWSLTAPAPAGRELAGLLAWDAPCLPDVASVSFAESEVALGGERRGRELSAACGWPQGQRLATSLQLLAATVFLVETGWYPSRRLLRTSRIERGADGVWLRLGRLPCRRLQEPALERRLRRRWAGEGQMIAGVLAPLLGALVPELAAELAAQNDGRPSWELPARWLATLVGGRRSNPALAHPDGRGRALWARRFHLGQAGVFWSGERAVLARLATAMRLERGIGDVTVVSGDLEPDEVGRAQVSAASMGCELVAITTLPQPGAAPLTLDTTSTPVWVFAPDPRVAVATVALAQREGPSRPRQTRRLLEAGAAVGFASVPAPSPDDDGGRALASPIGRTVLGWLETSPVGLSEEELRALGQDPGTLAGELERLSCAYLLAGRWYAHDRGVPRPEDRLRLLATKLPAGSLAARAADVGLGQRVVETLAWGGELLERGDAVPVFAVTGWNGAPASVALLAAEAALMLGRLSEARSLLDRVPIDERASSWHAVAAWWASHAAHGSAVEAELAGVVDQALPPRLRVRYALFSAALAGLNGERTKAGEWLDRAVELDGGHSAEPALRKAAWQGRDALWGLARERWSAWSNDERALYLLLRAQCVLERAETSAAGPALRAASRLASGDNTLLLAQIYGELGRLEFMRDRGVSADLHFRLAERLYEQVGSAHTTSVIRFNRGALACDRLLPDQARELLLAGRDMGASRQDATWCLEELELVRTELARGAFPAVRATLAALEPHVERLDSSAGLGRGLASLEGHLALADGDLVEAARYAAAADACEAVLITAVIRGGQGITPPPDLPERWGLAISARLLAAEHDGASVDARARAWRALASTPREAAVGIARAVGILRRQGAVLDASWALLLRHCDAVLRETGLDGWRRLLRAEEIDDPLELIEALDGIVCAGSDAASEERLARLGRALGLGFIEVARSGVRVAGWGEQTAAVEVVTPADLEVRYGGRTDALVQAVLTMLGRVWAQMLTARPATAEGGERTMLGLSDGMAAIREQIRVFAPLPFPVLLMGEPGTGKELVARELHRLSQRPGTFVPVNCAGIPATLLEGEVFGSVRGAYTGADRDRPGLVEEAEHGTLFLDEIGELPLELQGKLLRLLQEREIRRVGATRARRVDVRFVAATNRDLRAAVAGGAFRQDLHDRLAVGVIIVPPLRERSDDIVELAHFFTGKYAVEFNRPGVRLSPLALDLLIRGRWDGNVRELESTITLAVARARPGEVLGPERFPTIVERPTATPTTATWNAAFVQFKRDYFNALLKECGGNRSRAARRAGISRQTLHYHLRELGLGEE